MAQTTISDIAKKVGVSKSTVSRVINHASDVKESTRQKVLEAIQEARYSPSATARALSKQISDTIGVIVPEIDNPFFGKMLRGIIDEMDQYNLTLFCCNTDDTISKDLKSLNMLKNHQVRGLIYTPAVDYADSKDKHQLKKQLSELNVPIIQVDRIVNGINSDTITFSDEEAIYEATNALIRAGHKKIAIINANLNQSLARIRQKGFDQAMKDAHLPIEPQYEFFGDYRISKAYDLAMQMLSMPNRPTAVITCNNNTTIGLLQALRTRGECLNNIAFIGLDLVDTLDLTQANLNFIQRDSYTMGKRAVQLLIHRLAFPDTPMQTICLKPELLIRNLPPLEK